MEFTEKDHSYIESDEEREEGHVDTRSHQSGCDYPPGCKLFNE